MGERYVYSVFFNSICIFTMLYLKKALQIIVMSVLSSQSNFKCPFKFPTDRFLKSSDEDTDTLLGCVHDNL